jgi:hypothetical protein
MTTEETPDYTLTFDDSQEAKDRIYNIMLAWFKKRGHFTGESIQQSDSTYEDAPNLLEDVAENGFKFNQEWKE